MNLNYKYVGDLSFFIDGKNPDFINEDSKRIIEFFGLYYHDVIVKDETRDEHEQSRINHFNRNGYECLVIWEEELKDLDKVIKRILEFEENKKI